MASAAGLGSAALDATFVWPPFRRAPSPCSIEVVIDMTDFTRPARIVMPVNSNLQVEPESISPEGALTGFSDSVSNSLFASVDTNGLIASKAFTGTTTLVVSSCDGITRRSNLVIAPAISSVTFAEGADLILMDSQLQRYATAVMGDESCMSRFLTFSASDPAVAHVDRAGLVTGTGKGTATITALSSNGVTAT